MTTRNANLLGGLSFVFWQYIIHINIVFIYLRRKGKSAIVEFTGNEKKTRIEKSSTFYLSKK